MGAQQEMVVRRAKPTTPGADELVPLSDPAGDDLRIQGRPKADLYDLPHL